MEIWQIGDRCQLIARLRDYLWASGDSRRVCFRGDARMAEGTPWVEVIEQPKRRRTPRPAGVREFKIAPHYWRTKVWDRLRRRPSEPRWFLPSDPTPEYLKSLTSEEQVVERQRVPGKGWQDVIVWRPRVVQSTSAEQSFRRDNHWWIAEVACAALAHAMGMELPVDTPEPETPESYVARLTGRRS